MFKVEVQLLVSATVAEDDVNCLGVLHGLTNLVLPNSKKIPSRVLVTISTEDKDSEPLLRETSGVVTAVSIEKLR